MKKSIFLILLFIGLPACENSYVIEQTIMDESSPILLNGEEFSLSDIPILSVRNFDSLLIIRLIDSKDVIQIYNNRTYEFLGKIGTMGQGPDEWDSPKISNQFVKDSSSIKLWIQDARKTEIRLVNITESLKQSKSVYEEKIQISPARGLTQQSLVLDQDKIIGSTGVEAYNRHRLLLYDTKSQSITKKVDNPPLIENTNKFAGSKVYILYFHFINIHPDGEKIVSAMNRFDLINIYDKDLNPLKEITFSKIEPQPIVSSESEPGKYYTDLYSDTKYIFGLTLNQAANKPNLSEAFIRVMNWNGEHVATFTMNDRVTSFTVDMEGGYIYGIDYSKDKFLRYSIKDKIPSDETKELP
ncbi:BF3164 family lipoprotein [Roseivirga echinicomitans]